MNGMWLRKVEIYSLEKNKEFSGEFENGINIIKTYDAGNLKGKTLILDSILYCLGFPKPGKIESLITKNSLTESVENDLGSEVYVTLTLIISKDGVEEENKITRIFPEPKGKKNSVLLNNKFYSSSGEWSMHDFSKRIFEKLGISNIPITYTSTKSNKNFSEIDIPFVYELFPFVVTRESKKEDEFSYFTQRRIPPAGRVGIDGRDYLYYYLAKSLDDTDVDLMFQNKINREKKRIIKNNLSEIKDRNNYLSTILPNDSIKKNYAILQGDFIGKRAELQDKIYSKKEDLDEITQELTKEKSVYNKLKKSNKKVEETNKIIENYYGKFVPKFIEITIDQNLVNIEREKLFPYGVVPIIPNKDEELRSLEKINNLEKSARMILKDIEQLDKKLDSIILNVSLSKDVEDAFSLGIEKVMASNSEEEKNKIKEIESLESQSKKIVNDVNEINKNIKQFKQEDVSNLNDFIKAFIENVTTDKSDKTKIEVNSFPVPRDKNSDEYSGSIGPAYKFLKHLYYMKNIAKISLFNFFDISTDQEAGQDIQRLESDIFSQIIDLCEFNKKQLFIFRNFKTNNYNDDFGKNIDEFIRNKKVKVIILNSKKYNLIQDDIKNIDEKKLFSRYWKI